MNTLSLFVSLLWLSATINASGIGDRLTRTAILYSSLPMTVKEAVSAGWTRFTDCDENLGIGYTHSSGGTAPSKTNPITVYFTAGGQIAGIAMEHFGLPLSSLSQYWIPSSNGNFRINVSFRSNSQGLCRAGRMFPEVLGTQLVVNQGNGSWALPLNETAATQAQWTKGGCIGDMGTHWSLDLSTAPKMSWLSSNLFPVVTMYNEQATGAPLSAFFITTPHLQYSEPLGPWEGPIPEFLMCYNWCDSDCSWDVSAFNTLHFYVDNHKLNTCPAHCSS